MPFALTLRPAGPRDFAFLVDLIRAAYRDLCIRQFGFWNDAAEEERLARKIQDVPHRIIELELRPIGAVATIAHDDHVTLAELSLLPEFQNRGIGSRILRDEFESARAAGKPLRLHTPTLNRACSFYLRNGFVQTGVDGHYANFERTQ